MLIIDDGWQSTDVDAELRQPVSQKLRLAEPMRELDETQGEFIEAELEMLQMSARDVPAGSTLGTAVQPAPGINPSLALGLSLRSRAQVLHWRRCQRMRRTSPTTNAANPIPTCPGGKASQSGDDGR